MPYQDVVFAEGDCLQNDQVEQILENLNTFAKCGGEVSEQFKCTAIQPASMTAPFGSETCFEIQNGANVSPVDSEIEQKILFLDFSVTFAQGANGSDVDLNRTTFSQSIRVLCDGIQVDTINTDSNILGVACFECSTASTVEVCITGDADNFQTSNVVGNATASICGALVCTGTVAQTGLANFFLPEFTPCGKYGRDFLHSVLKSIRRFSDAFSDFGQVPTCRNEVFDDDEDHVLVLNSPTDFEYLILGHIEICIERTGRGGVLLTAQPSALCGSQISECNERRLVLSALNSSTSLADIDTEPCLRFPVVFCGTCKAGESLTIGFQQNIDCEGTDGGVALSGASVTSVTQDYCAYFFNRLQTDLAGTGIPLGLPRCIPFETFQSISESMTGINAVCEAFRPVNSTIRTKPEGSSTFTTGESALLQEALPWPPINDSTNTDPVPIKKWFLTLNVEACFTAQISSDAPTGGFIQASVEILCGGTPIAVPVTARLPLTETFRTRPRCVSLQFQGCIECPIDQDITLEFDSFEQSDGSIISSSFDCDYKMICY